MRAPLAVLLSLLTSTALGQQGAQPQTFEATLAGHALVPAATSVPAPADAPPNLRVSGKYTDPAQPGRRIDGIGVLEGSSFLSAKEASRRTGYKMPMDGQPVQGFSGVKSLGGGAFLVLTDNGFGSRGNSPDAMLMFHEVRPDFASGRAAVARTTFLHDPDRKAPFAIVNEGTEKRYLTGADFDIESIQPAGDSLWFGDEFGPYLIETDRSGKLLSVHETVVGGKPARSPDHYAVTTPATPTATVAFTVRRSRGYEGMAASKDGRFLYPLLEGPIWDAEKKDWERVDGKEALRILEFSLADKTFTGRSWLYALEENGNNIGDFNMIDATTALIVERDNGEGDAARACQPGAAPSATCFNAPAKFKRVYKVEMTEATAGKPVRKIGSVDLLAIKDPRGLAKQGGADGRLTFPFVTIESVDAVDERHIIVGNDNNFPYSAGREPLRQDDNELVLLEVEAFLKAR